MNLYVLQACLQHVAEVGEEHQRKLRKPLIAVLAGFVVLVMGGDSLFGYNESWYLATVAGILFATFWFAHKLYIVLRDTSFRDRFDENGNFQ